jgi:hypothetical protein
VSKLVDGGGSGKASEIPESIIGVVGELKIKQKKIKKNQVV